MYNAMRRQQERQAREEEAARRAERMERVLAKIVEKSPELDGCRTNDAARLVHMEFAGLLRNERVFDGFTRAHPPSRRQCSIGRCGRTGDASEKCDPKARVPVVQPKERGWILRYCSSKGPRRVWIFEKIQNPCPQWKRQWRSQGRIHKGRPICGHGVDNDSK
ncbi:unnamed protein product [Caenorhabditis nigoni]